MAVDKMPDVRLPVLSKHNVRHASNDRWIVEVWTDATILHTSPVGVGVRVTDHMKQPQPPGATISIRFLHNDRPNDAPRLVSFPLELTDLAIKGGYNEIVYGPDGTPLDKPARPCGEVGIWEVLLENPVETDPGKNRVERGKYLIDVELLLEDGARFKFEGLPVRFVRTRADTKL